jgi:hypothetical protein
MGLVETRSHGGERGWDWDGGHCYWTVGTGFASRLDLDWVFPDYYSTVYEASVGGSLVGLGDRCAMQGCEG